MFSPSSISALTKLAEFKKHRFYKYALSVLIVSAATLLQNLTWEWLYPAPYIFYFPAIVLAALYGDGNSAIILSCILSQYYFVAPYGFLNLTWPGDYFRMGVFVVAAEMVKKIIRIQTEDKLKAEAAVMMLERREKDLEYKREAREKIVSTLSHDLQTPLTAVMLNGQMIMRQYGEQDDKLNLAMMKQLRNLHRIEAMIRDLLDANSIRAGVKIPIIIDECHLCEIIAHTMQDLIHIHGERFKVECEESIKGHWSSDAIKRILENLCTNAVKYGDENSKISITAQQVENGVLLRINNKGNPIPDDEQKILFDSFRRTDSAIESKKKGWGLGLFLVKGLTEAHNGVVSVESNQIHGTTFTVYLPLDARQDL